MCTSKVCRRLHLWLCARLQATMIVLLIIAPGCTHMSESSKGPSGPPPKLITSGSCLEFKDAPANANVEEFTRRVGELLSQNKQYSATRLVERFPDLANAAVNRTSAETSYVVAFIRDVHLRQVSRTDLYAAVNQHLSAGEKQRRARREADWHASWEQAVQLVLALVPDPNLWEKISSLQPAKEPWPDAVGIALRDYWARRGQKQIVQMPAIAQDLVWFSIGHWHMERGETKAAWVAFEHASNPSSSPMWKDMIELFQAKTLDQLKQGPAAITILTRLASKEDSPWRRPALAVIGSCKFRAKQDEQALAFYMKALETSPRAQGNDGEDFLGRTEAESDLGLMLLATRYEAKGLAQLHAAREAFAKAGKIDAVLESLGNEIRYFENTRREDHARPLRDEFMRWQQSRS